MRALRADLLELLASAQPVTVRQAFYLAVSAMLVAKTEQEYKGTICRLLGEMRREGVLPWEWIADHTRWMRKPQTYTSLEQALVETAQLYRRSVWRDQDAYVEVWLEKDALAGVLYPITELWDVPLMVSRGYANLSYLYEAAQAIKAQRKPAFIYYFGDWDPSGVDIPRNIEEQLRTFSGGADITFCRVAVQPWQIATWQLPTRPTKTSDSRSKAFTGESVEVDAIPPQRLRDMVTECIEQHIDRQRLERLALVEERERDILTFFTDHSVIAKVEEILSTRAGDTC
jgi:hypothetical protein